MPFYYFPLSLKVTFKIGFSDPLLSSLNADHALLSIKQGNKNGGGGDVTQDRTVSYP